MPTPVYEPSFLQEVWTLFAVGAGILVLRVAVRARTVGIRQFDGDDYLSLLVLLCYIGDAVTVNLTYRLGSNVDFTKSEFEAMSPAELNEVVLGSRLQLLAWYSYTALIWALKGCMLFFFGRLTSGLSLQKYVRYLSVACVVSYIAVFLTISCGCFPIQKNWQVVPDPGSKCTARPQNLYVTSTANVLTDALILLIPVPMLWNLEASRRRKLGLSLLLFPGVFVIAAALIRVIMSLEARPSALNLNRWGVRETVAGIVAVNVPILRPMLRTSFWTRGPVLSQPSASHGSGFGDRGTSGKWTLSSSSAPSGRARPYMSYDTEQQQPRATGVDTKANTFVELKDLSDGRSNGSTQSRTNSEEFIIQRAQAPSRQEHAGNNGVLVETCFESSVEYCHEDLRPAVPRGLGKDDSDYVASVSHTRGRR